MRENVYINFSKCTETKNEKIRISEVANVWCSNEKILAHIKNVVIGRVDGIADRVLTFSVISIIQLLEEKIQNITIINLGDPEFLVVYKHKKRPSIIWQVVKVVFISGIVFCGGAFAIMAYGNDIDIGNLFGAITEYFVGENSDKKIIMELSYSVGLSIGVILFFNNWGKRKKVKDPTPIQMSMRNYEEEIYKTIIENNVREGKMGDGN